MDIGKQVCSCSVELRCSAEERLVVGQGEGVRETRIEKLDNALRKSRDEPYLTSGLERLKKRKV